MKRYPLRTLLRTPVPTETLTSLLRSTSFKEPSKNPSKSRVLLHDPLGVRAGFCECYVERMPTSEGRRVYLPRRSLQLV